MICGCRTIKTIWPGFAARADKEKAGQQDTVSVVIKRLLVFRCDRPEKSVILSDRQ
jgi:hypothetical protein